MPENTITFHDKHVIDAFEQAAIQDWLPLEITQISAGDYQGDIRTIEHPDVSVTFENQNRTVHKRGVMSEGLCTVSFCRDTHSQHRFSEYIPEENSLFLLPSGTEFDIHLAENTNTVYFKLDQSALLDKLRAINPFEWEKEQNNLLILDMINRRSLNDLTELLFSSNQFMNNREVSQYHSQLGSIIIDQIVMTMNSSISSNEQKQPERMSLGRARGVVNRFIDFVLAEFQQQRCPSIVDICLGLQISQRTLQYSFKKILGITPIAYLRYHRLNKVRHQLLIPANENVTVTDIATRWNFLHLGKFSHDYNQMFGELPSKTLHRTLGKLKKH